MGYIRTYNQLTLSLRPSTIVFRGLRLLPANVAPPALLGFLECEANEDRFEAGNFHIQACQRTLILFCPRSVLGDPTLLSTAAAFRRPIRGHISLLPPLSPQRPQTSLRRPYRDAPWHGLQRSPIHYRSLSKLPVKHRSLERPQMRPAHRC